MQLIVILLVVVSVLTFLSGVATFFGASKKDRTRAARFFLATIFATIWSVSIGIFMMAEPDWSERMHWHVNWTYISAIFIDVALLGFIAWHQKYGKIATSVFAIFGIILASCLAANPSLLYTDIILTRYGNSLVTNIGPFYVTYIIFFCLLVPTVIFTLLRQIMHSHSPKKRGADLVLLIGFAISGTMALIFDLIVPLWDWSLIWIGPVAISTTIIAFYYTILRYRILNLSSRWIKILSYVVIITSIAVVYMVIFAIVFAALFRGATPSLEVIILNFIMILIFLALTPAMNEFTKFTRFLISGEKKPQGEDTLANGK